MYSKAEIYAEISHLRAEGAIPSEFEQTANKVLNFVFKNLDARVVAPPPEPEQFDQDGSDNAEENV